MNNKIVHEFNCQLPLSSFTKTEQGDYCSDCKTVVIDFTEKSTEEIQEIIKLNGGSVCGTAYKEQISPRLVAAGFRKRIAAVGLTAMLGIVPVAGKSQPADTVQTELLKRAPVAGPTISENSAGDTIDSPVIDTPVEPEKKAKLVKRKTFLRLGRRRFYVMNIFPFIGTSRPFSGKYRTTAIPRF